MGGAGAVPPGLELDSCIWLVPRLKAWLHHPCCSPSGTGGLALSPSYVHSIRDKVLLCLPSLPHHTPPPATSLLVSGLKFGCSFCLEIHLTFRQTFGYIYLCYNPRLKNQRTTEPSFSHSLVLFSVRLLTLVCLGNSLCCTSSWSSSLFVNWFVLPHPLKLSSIFT